MTSSLVVVTILECYGNTRKSHGSKKKRQKKLNAFILAINHWVAKSIKAPAILLMMSGDMVS